MKSRILPVGIAHSDPQRRDRPGGPPGAEGSRSGLGRRRGPPSRGRRSCHRRRSVVVNGWFEPVAMRLAVDDEVAPQHTTSVSPARSDTAWTAAPAPIPATKRAPACSHGTLGGRAVNWVWARRRARLVTPSPTVSTEARGVAPLSRGECRRPWLLKGTRANGHLARIDARVPSRERAPDPAVWSDDRRPDLQLVDPSSSGRRRRARVSRSAGESIRPSSHGPMHAAQ